MGEIVKVCWNCGSNDRWIISVEGVRCEKCGEQLTEDSQVFDAITRQVQETEDGNV